MVSEDLYGRLAELVEPGTLGGVFDSKRPDRFDVVLPIAVFALVSDVPSEKTIDGVIAIRESRWQVSVFALKLSDARAAKEAVIAKLHGFASTAIKTCQFATAPGEIYESEIVPPEWHIPVDFMVTQ